MVKRFFLHSEETPSMAIDRVKDALDFTECERLISEFEPLRRRNDISDQLQNSINRAIDFAISMGWDAAKNPAKWIFQDGDISKGPTDVAPYEHYAAKQFEISRLWDFDTSNEALEEASGDLHSLAERSAFRLGWESAFDATWLIFERESEGE